MMSSVRVGEPEPDQHANAAIPRDDADAMLVQELVMQQEIAVERMAPGIVVVLSAYAIIGFAKYWPHIPLAGGLVWASVLVTLLGASLFRLWRVRTGRRLLVQGGTYHRAGTAWVLALGCLFAVGVIFVMPFDDAVGRVSFAAMAFSLAGMTLASTYMVPRLTVAFMTPIIMATLYGALTHDPEVSAFQKLGTLTGFVITATIVVRMNWLLFRSSVKVMVDREQHRTALVQRQVEMDAASRIQQRLLPDADTLPAGEERFNLAVIHRSAQEMTGDLYDFFMMDDDRLFFMVGDVCGKGVTSSLLMAMTKVMMKSAVRRQYRPIGEMVSQVNQELMQEDHDAQFVTCFTGILNARTGVLDFCNAGHEPARVFSTDGAELRRSERVGGPPLCAFEDMAYESGRLTLAPGETILVVTDGVTEAMNPADEEFGSVRLDALLATRFSGNKAANLLDDILAAVEVHAAGRPMSDDLTMLTVHRTAGVGA